MGPNSFIAIQILIKERSKLDDIQEVMCTERLEHRAFWSLEPWEGRRRQQEMRLECEAEVSPWRASDSSLRSLDSYPLGNRNSQKPGSGTI